MYDSDELKGRFTVYMEKIVLYARIDYLNKLSYRKMEISTESVPETVDYSTPQTAFFTESFDFHEERIEDAFTQLSLLRQRILIYMFVDDLPITEIAERLNCSENYVCLQKHRAIKQLRNLLTGGGDSLGK